MMIRGSSADNQRSSEVVHFAKVVKLCAILRLLPVNDIMILDNLLCYRLCKGSSQQGVGTRWN